MAATSRMFRLLLLSMFLLLGISIAGSWLIDHSSLRAASPSCTANADAMRSRRAARLDRTPH